MNLLPKSPPEGWVTERGWYDMLCFNSLDGELQRRLVYWGNLPLGHAETGRCHNPAEVEITTVYDAMPGPRFYCLECAVMYLAGVFQERQRNQAEALEAPVTTPTPDTEVSQ